VINRKPGNDGTTLVDMTSDSMGFRQRDLEKFVGELVAVSHTYGTVIGTLEAMKLSAGGDGFRVAINGDGFHGASLRESYHLL
jgi:hypothetical protein